VYNQPGMSTQYYTSPSGRPAREAPPQSVWSTPPPPPQPHPFDQYLHEHGSSHGGGLQWAVNPWTGQLEQRK
jgi:hypothetical protein